jgi:cytochrome c biogenesis protein ResB
MFFFAGGHLPIRPPFEVLSVQPFLFSGIQVSYDPGFPVIVVGVLSMLLGLAALFYLHQRKVLIFLKPGSREKETRIEVGGWSSRGEKEFEREFQSLFKPLTPALSPLKGERE